MSDRATEEANRILIKSEKHGWTKCSGILAHCAIRDEIADALRSAMGTSDDGAPWWVLGAEINSMLAFLDVPATIAKLSIRGVDNEDGFCLREQLWFDCIKLGLNQDAGKKMRRAMDKLEGNR